ncbi:hypothetical protein K8942_00785 [Candidatus Peribacteria bacterium]|nr:MAG: hypothetical protein K8942_00785 [Candidatus Peribacteria bacterium]
MITEKRTVLVQRREPYVEDGLTIEVVATSKIILNMNNVRVDCPKGKGVWDNHLVDAVLKGGDIEVTIYPEGASRPVARAVVREGLTQDQVRTALKMA